MTTPWIVGALLTLFAGNSLLAVWITERMRQRSTQNEQKITDTGLALGGFKDLVADLRAERVIDKARITQLEAENADLKATIASRYQRDQP